MHKMLRMSVLFAKRMSKSKGKHAVLSGGVHCAALSDRRRAQDMAASIRESPCPVGKVAGSYLGGTQVLDLRESPCTQFGVERVCLHVIQPGFAQFGDALGAPFMADAPFHRQGSRGITIIEHDVCAVGETGDETEG